MKILSGTCIGPYEILAPIGPGRIGVVYKACNIHFDRFNHLR
jgi:hypothetical protein